LAAPPVVEDAEEVAPAACPRCPAAAPPAALVVALPAGSASSQRRRSLDRVRSAASFPPPK